MMMLSTEYHCNPVLDEFQTVSETVKAIKFLSSSKAPGSDAIPAQIYKAEVIQLHRNIMWIKEAIPQEFVYKECNNHPPIQMERESSSVIIIGAFLY